MDVGESPTPASTSPATHIETTKPGTASTIEVIDPPPDLHIPSIHATTLGAGQSRDGNIDQVYSPPSNTAVEPRATGHGGRGEILQVPGGTNIFAADVHRHPNTTTGSRSPRNNPAAIRRRPRPDPRVTESLQDAVVTSPTAVSSQSSQTPASPPGNAPQLEEITGDAVQDVAVDHTTVSPQPQTLASPPENAPQPEEITGDAEDVAQPERSGYGQRDNVQLVEICNPEGSGWSALSKFLRDYDEEEIKYYKEDIDTLLVFAGLYSAVLSAFIIESYQYLQPDPEDKMVFLFQQMLSQNYTMSNGFLNATNPYPALPAFEAPTWAIRVNILWFSSLVVSLAAASYGMLVKQWLREYLDLAGCTSPHERLRAHQYRRPALKHWKVFEIAASLPLLLELALGIFFVGLCYFTTEIHPRISRSTIVLVAAWAFFFLAATIAPLFSPRCPYKTTFFRGSMKRVRCAIVRLFGTCIIAYASVVKCAWAAYFACASAIHTVASTTSASLISPIIRLRRGTNQPRTVPAALSSSSDRAKILSGLDYWVDDLRMRLKIHMKEEGPSLYDLQCDIEILWAVEEIMPGDGLLLTIADIAREAKNRWDATLRLISRIVYNRTGRDMFDPCDEFALYNPIDPSRCIQSLQSLSEQAYDVLTTWACNILLDHRNAVAPFRNTIEETQCCTLFFCLIAAHRRPLPEFHRQTFRRLILCHPDRLHPPLLGNWDFRSYLGEIVSGNSEWPPDVFFDTWASVVEGLFSKVEAAVMIHILSLIASGWQASSPSGRPRKGRSPQPFSKSHINKFLDVFCKTTSDGPVDPLRLVSDSEPQVFYGILLGAAQSNQAPWGGVSQLFSRDISRLFGVDDNSKPLYHQRGHNSPSHPKTAFLSLMKTHSATWVPTVLGWLTPGRMPGNILAQIVAADIASSTPDDQLRKLDGIIEICRMAALRIPTPDDTDHEIDFSSLLQIIALLAQPYIFNWDGEIWHSRHKKVPSVRRAFRVAVVRRHAAYRVLMVVAIKVLQRPILHPEPLKRYNSRLSNLVGRMRRERLDLVYGMTIGCCHGGNWAGVVNQRFAPGEGMRLVVGRDLDSASQALEATSLALRSTEHSNMLVAGKVGELRWNPPTSTGHHCPPGEVHRRPGNIGERQRPSLATFEGQRVTQC